MTNPTTIDTPDPPHADLPASTPSRGTALVTGASGYIGSHLVPALISAGWTVRVLTRSTNALVSHDWVDDVDVVVGNATNDADLDAALAGVDVAYYLLHSMDGQGDFEARDRALAQSFADACTRQGVGRIVYLGGLHPSGADLSPHLASRVEVGEVFLASDVPAACLQAAVVIGDGSASFDMLRHLTERLPAMIAPKWLNNRLQPIAIDDAIRYLVGAADFPPEVNRTFDIGGPDVLTYRQMIHRFAQVTGLRRRIVATLPVLTPGLASHWVALVTPVSAGVAKPLVGSLVHDVVCEENDIKTYLPDPPEGLIGFNAAVDRAMGLAKPSPGRRNLLATTAAVALAASAGSWATDPESSWYLSLNKPAWQPPPAAFPLVWSGLYASLAGASASALTNLQDRQDHEQARQFAAALGVNLVLNAGWSAAFFRARNLPFATGWAAALTGSSIDLARRAGKASPGHRRALVPYAAWCAFATVLSGAVARRNP